MRQWKVFGVIINDEEYNSKKFKLYEELVKSMKIKQPDSV